MWMKDWRRWILAVGGAVIGAAYLAAQPADEATTTVSPVDDATLTVAQMNEKAIAVVKEIEELLVRVRETIKKSVGEKDMIKLDCLRHAEKRLVGLLDVARAAQADLSHTPSAERQRATFAYEKALISAEVAVGLASDASSCAGGAELDFGEDRLEVEGPEVRDDPTRDKMRADGYDPTRPEQPGQGSPF